MKGICIGLLFALLAGGVFAETPQKVASDAGILLEQQQEKSAENHQFMEESVLVSRENRYKLNDYRSKFRTLSGQIYVVKNKISAAIDLREPDIAMLTSLREQLQGLIDDHDKLIGEFRQWVSTLN